MKKIMLLVACLLCSSWIGEQIAIASDTSSESAIVQQHEEFFGYYMTIPVPLGTEHIDVTIELQSNCKFRGMSPPYFKYTFTPPYTLRIEGDAFHLGFSKPGDYLNAELAVTKDGTNGYYYVRFECVER